MLTVGAAGVTANASAVLPNPDTCPHSWTAEERHVSEWTEKHQTNSGKTCTITHTEVYYDIVCRTCGTKVGKRTESLTSKHSIVHEQGSF